MLLTWSTRSNTFLSRKNPTRVAKLSWDFSLFFLMTHHRRVTLHASRFTSLTSLGIRPSDRRIACSLRRIRRASCGLRS